MVENLKKWFTKLFKKTATSSKSLVCFHDYEHVGQTWKQIKKNTHLLVDHHICTKCDAVKHKPIEEHK